eukprot:CAMPEP_0198145240 /NCGR_PEP_ID=MMETSP1443-20131203/22167_1 /TAXON_ID=186043 /ORGANISM="Entomoneis sp., Strain CCMP2396" /LENGTH=333 /DNA_ID=CAMNT_0043808821 /DNA_START=137 /DNA_END=1136 /DNA_ORIENTATION=-
MQIHFSDEIVLVKKHAAAESGSESSYNKEDAGVGSMGCEGNQQAPPPLEETSGFIPELGDDLPEFGPGQVSTLRHKSGSKRLLLVRLHSKMIRSVSGEGDDTNNFCPEMVESTQFLDLIDREVQRKPKRTLLKTHSLKRCKSGFVTKSVRFAVNAQNDKVWCTVRTFEKATESQKRDLWWTDDDKDQTKEEEFEEEDEKRYGDFLYTAYESAIDAGPEEDDIIFPFAEYVATSSLRGLETSFCRKIRKLIQQHRKAVLENSSETGGKILNDSEVELLRLQSLKFSRASKLVAFRMGELDSKIITYMADFEHSLYDSSSVFGSSGFAQQRLAAK